MRDVAKSDKNTAAIYDRIGGCNVHLFFRMPTSAERADHDRAQLKIKGKKLLNKSFETNLFFGKKLCTGLKLAIKDSTDKFDDGLCYEGKPFSSDPDDGEYYREDWKALIEKTSADILVQLSAFIFNAAGVEDGEDEDDELGANDEGPLPTENT